MTERATGTRFARTSTAISCWCCSSAALPWTANKPWGDRLHLAEVRPGDNLGEMSPLGSGLRFSVCPSLTDCEIAVLGAQALDEMMTANPALAASLIALRARKQSRRMRAVSAQLSEKK